MRITWPPQTQARLACGEVSPPLGWISRSFDVKQPCSTIVVSGETTGRLDAGRPNFRCFPLNAGIHDK